MHHSPKHVLVLVVLRRSDLFHPPSPRRRRRHKSRPHHLQRQENMPLRIRIQRLPGNAFHQRAQHNKINVAINKSRTRCLLRSLRKRHPVSRLLTLPRTLQVQIRLQPRVVRQKLPHRDVVLPVLRKLRQILRHRIIQPHLPLLDQLHHRSSSSNHLGKRRQIKNRIQSHRLALRLQSPRPIGLPVDNLPVVAHNQNRSRNLLLLNRLLNNSINPRQRECGDSRSRLPALSRAEGSLRAQPRRLCSGTPRAENEACSDSTQPRQHDSRNSSKGVPLMPYHDSSMTAPHPPSTPLKKFEHQDKIFAQAFAILQEAIAQQAFPAASIAVTYRGTLVALKGLGSFTYEEKPGGGPSFASFAKGGEGTVHPSTLFDLASLTKVLATTPTAMLLYERGLLDLEAPVSAMVPEFTRDKEKDPRRREVTLRMLLAHSSGLPAHEEFFLKAHTRAELLQAAFTTPLAANPATQAVYSDVGFIILGVALERLADESLDRFSQREIFAPLAMTNTTFNPPPEIRSQIPPTADEREEPCGSDTPVRQLPKASPPQS